MGESYRLYRKHTKTTTTTITTKIAATTIPANIPGLSSPARANLSPASPRVAETVGVLVELPPVMCDDDVEGSVSGDDVTGLAVESGICEVAVLVVEGGVVVLGGSGAVVVVVVVVLGGSAIVKVQNKGLK